MTTTTTETMSLTDQIDAAEATAAAARQCVGTTQAALTRAVSTGHYDQAAQLQDEVAAARDALIVADAHVTALRAGKAAAERERVVEDQAIAEARQRDQADQDLDAARADEVRRLGQVDGALNAMWAAVAEAQRHLNAALAFEEAVNHARHAINDARRRRGDWPSDHPGPAVARSNKIDVLTDGEPLIRALRSWAPPR